MFRKNNYGIDLGTDEIKIYEQSRSRLIRKKNRIALRNEKEILAVGDEAYAMEGRTPREIQIIRPMSGGRIDDLHLMEAVLERILRREIPFPGFFPHVFLAVPSELTDLDRRLYSTITTFGRWKYNRLFVVERPIADALSIGLPIHHTKGAMIANLGADATEVSVIADQRVLLSRSLPFGGNDLNYEIAAEIRRRRGLSISLASAEECKKEMVHLTKEISGDKLVKGIDAETGLPSETMVTPALIHPAIDRSLQRLSDFFYAFIPRIPPQVWENIQKEGISLTGGTARLPGLSDFLSERWELSIHLSKQYELSTIDGLKLLIEKPQLRHWAVPAAK